MRVKNFVMWCGVADDSVVVIKTQPVKAGNSVEGKTELTWCLSSRGVVLPKGAHACEGMKFILMLCNIKMTR